jgi:hypothetical protein
MRRSRSGQSATEYIILLSAVLVVFNIVALTLRRYIPQLTERLLNLIVDTALNLALP